MNRKFLYMTAMNVKRSSYTLHRIKASQLFYPKGAPDSAAAAVEDRSVPPPTMAFHPPRNKIVCTDERGRAVLYDDGLQAVRMLPSLKKAKWKSVPLAVGDNLLVMEAIPKNDQKMEHQSFEALMYGERPKMFKGWTFSGTPSPTALCLCPWLCSSILISTESLGTYCLDTVSGKWSKSGAWPLPFKGLAEYVPEYDLWFGVSAKRGGILCASDLGAASAKQTPPVAFQEWEGFAAPEGTELGSHLLHLGAGRFCRRAAIVDKLVMFTGVEIQRCGRGLKVIKHRSFRYSMDACSMAKILY
ncbi:hypothetical protein VPH35_046273 [Triticum aestivum]